MTYNCRLWWVNEVGHASLTAWVSVSHRAVLYCRVCLFCTIYFIYCMYILPSPHFHSLLYVFNHKISLLFSFLVFDMCFIQASATGSWSLIKRGKADHQAAMLCTRHYFFHLSKLNGTWDFPLACQYFHKIWDCLMKLEENSCTMTLPCMLSWCHIALCNIFFWLFEDWSTKRITITAHCSSVTAVAHIYLSHQSAQIGSCLSD